MPHADKRGYYNGGFPSFEPPSWEKKQPDLYSLQTSESSNGKYRQDRYQLNRAERHDEYYDGPTNDKYDRSPGYDRRSPSVAGQYDGDADPNHFKPPMLPRTVVKQPRYVGRQARPWTSSLFDCAADPSICICVCCNPLYACMRMRDFGESCLVPCCLGPVGALVALRYNLRREDGIEGSLLNDCYVAACCYGCALCQLVREEEYLAKPPHLADHADRIRY